MYSIGIQTSLGRLYAYASLDESQVHTCYGILWVIQEGAAPLAHGN